jgi:hypothetical protein
MQFEFIMLLAAFLICLALASSLRLFSANFLRKASLLSRSLQLSYSNHNTLGFSFDQFHPLMATNSQLEEKPLARCAGSSPKPTRTEPYASY